MKKDLGFIQKLTRLYTFYSPIRKGKNRIALASLKLQKDLPKQVVTKTIDGRKLKVNFHDHFAHFVYFLGEYETAITRIIKDTIDPGDICLDIGANIGWFTTLFQTLVGKTGQVHSFEPIPDTFEILLENVGSNQNSQVVRLNNFALGDVEKEINLHIPKNKTDGHASLSDFGNKKTIVFPAKMKTLDSYLLENKIGEVKFVKADIEGAELSMLKGAKRLFDQERPPILEIEMALDTSKGFGFLPNDLIEYISKQCDYEFYAIDEKTFSLTMIRGFSAEDQGANVLCIPKGFYRDKLEKLNIKE